MRGRIAIVGAGLAGVAAAWRLSAAGHNVVLLDKGRGPGGRLASRRTTVDGQEVRFDHGAPGVPWSDGPFEAFTSSAMASGVADSWPAGGASSLIVGLPSMKSLVEWGLTDFDVRFNAEVTGLTRGPAGWALAGVESDEAFVAVIVTVPAPQQLRLTGTHAQAFHDAASSARYDPCWTIMLTLERGIGRVPTLGEPPADVALAIVEASKPGRDDSASVVVHLTPEASHRLLEEDRETIASVFAPQIREAYGLPPISHAQAHRWRYCRVSAPATLEAVYDPQLNLGVAGDWTLGPDANHAFESGTRVADAVVKAFEAHELNV